MNTSTMPQGKGFSSRESVGYEQVAAVCEALVAASDKVTVRRVQAEVGGSNTTILNHLRRWQDTQRAAAVAGPVDGILTDQVRAALVTWAKTRESEARADAERRAVELDELYVAAKEGWEMAESRITALEAELLAERERGATTARESAEALAAAEGHAAAADKQIAQLQEHVATEQKNAETSRMAAAEARIKADAAAEAVRTLGKENEAMRARSAR